MDWIMKKWTDLLNAGEWWVDNCGKKTQSAVIISVSSQENKTPDLRPLIFTLQP